MYIIEKEYFVIYNDNTILMYGKRNGQFVTALVAHAEFDTDAEMQAYITEHELVLPTGIDSQIELESPYTEPQPEVPPYAE